MRFPIAILALFATFSSAFAMLIARQLTMPSAYSFFFLHNHRV